MEKLCQSIAATMTAGGLAAWSFAARDLTSILAGIASLLASIFAIRAAAAACKLHRAQLNALHESTTER